MLSRRIAFACVAWGILGALGGGLHAEGVTTADYEALLVGHWKMEPRAEDDLAIIDGEMWARANRNQEGEVIAPDEEELAAYRKERVPEMARASARHAELAHDIYEPGGRLVRVRRADAKRDEGKVSYGTYKVELEESGRYVLVLQMEGYKASRQLMYVDTIQEAFRQGPHAWNVGSQFRLLDGDHFQHAVVRDKMPQVYHVRTYVRVEEPPAWVKTVLAREAKGAAGVVVRVDQGALTIDGVKLSFPCVTEDLFDALGEPDRERYTEFNTIYLWDKLGIVAHEKPLDDTVHSFTLYFDVEKLDKKIWPKEAFPGKLIVDDLPLHGRMSLEEVNKDRAKPFETREDFKKWKEIRHGKLTVTLESAPQESQEKGRHFERLFLETQK